MTPGKGEAQCITAHWHWNGPSARETLHQIPLLEKPMEQLANQVLLENGH